MKVYVSEMDDLVQVQNLLEYFKRLKLIDCVNVMKSMRHGGCFLTGYNFSIIRDIKEIMQKSD